MKLKTKNRLQPIYWIYRPVKLVFHIVFFIIGIVGTILHESSYYTTIKFKTWVAQDKIRRLKKLKKLNEKYSELCKAGKNDEANKVYLKIQKLEKL